MVPAPGPLVLCTQLALLHLALLAPALGRFDARWSIGLLLLALPALALVSYGRSGGALLWCGAVVASAAASGAAAQSLPAGRRIYLASITLLLALPFALAYLCEEFGNPAAATVVRAWSPWAGASLAACDAAPPNAALLLLWAWPVGALTWRTRTWRRGR